MAAISREPKPLEAAILSECVTQLMAELHDDRERQMLTLTLQGFSADEIAVQVGRTRRTINRVLARVRGKLQRCSAMIEAE